MAKKKEEKIQVRIAPPNHEFIEMHISNEGLPSMIVHRFSEKAQQQLKDIDNNKKGTRKGVRPARNPEQEYQDSLYRMPDKNNVFGVPTAGFKHAMVRAAKAVDGITMTDMKMAFWVLEDDGGLVKIEGKPNLHESIVRLSGPGRPPQIRYRGEFKDWSAILKIRFDADLFTAEEIINLCARAGSTVGWGERRLEKGYDHGGWIIKKAKVSKCAA